MTSKGKWFCPECCEFKKVVMFGNCMDCGTPCRFFSQVDKVDVKYVIDRAKREAKRI